ncbi:peptidase S28 [Rickenella mellea]|uniref:Peptidase S28 n=1 Tax=Rickenella mellea TaxID=50990 RepID=A0A4R5XFN0_9AGAM|nr:peptidase S28 [Rickenella mellea]
MRAPFLLLGVASCALAALPDGRPHGNMAPSAAIPRVSIPKDTPVTSQNGTTLPAYSTVYRFKQLIDHNNPSLGTFNQRYWHTYEFYQAGGPIILFTPGEIAADGYYGYLTNTTINGMIAQQQHGATIVLEHRFFGTSNPKSDLSAQSLKLLTVQQAINDLAYFAQNVVLPMPGGNQVTPDKAPWILMGGSYSGALTSWTMVNKPGIFWAGYASSAVVQAITPFWQYFDPIRQFMPQNCSADVQAVTAYVDQVLNGNSTTAITQLKSVFGLSGLSHSDDFAGALRNNLWEWQSLQPDSGTGGAFQAFCDKLEVKNGVSAPASGWGLNTALQAWGNYWNQSYYTALCGGSDAETCLGTYDVVDEPFWTDPTLGNAARSWSWLVCNELGFFQDGAPTNQPTLVSRIIQPAYDLRQCAHWFPSQFPNAAAQMPNTTVTNTRYQGWNVAVDRLFFANGKRDPWRDATVSSDFYTRQSTSMQPIAVSDGFHCSDMSKKNAMDATVAAVQTQALASMKTWLGQWKPNGTISTSVVPFVQSHPSSSPSPSVAVPKRVNVWLKSSG